MEKLPARIKTIRAPNKNEERYIDGTEKSSPPVIRHILSEIRAPQQNLPTAGIWISAKYSTGYMQYRMYAFNQQNEITVVEMELTSHLVQIYSSVSLCSNGRSLQQPITVTRAMQ